MSESAVSIETPEQTQKTNLLGLSREQMEQFFKDIGEKPFRATQLMKWIHQQGVDDFEQMTNLSKSLRQKLSEVAEVRGPEVLYKDFSKDGTRKWVLQLDGGGQVEAVLIPEGDRATLCVSSQVGCALDCKFCSTGKQGFQRDLTPHEIIGQVWVANRSFPQVENKGHRNITNVVMMGMGEPLLNFDNVVTSLHLMKDDFGYGISRRRVTVSTSGIVPGIDRLSEEIDVSLALSLHAPNDELRDRLVPINKKYPLSEVLASCKRFLAKHESTSHRSITMEYVLLKGVNDQPEHAQELAELLRGIPCKINLIPFNPFPHSGFKRPSGMESRKFQDRLIRAGYTTTVRTTRGEDIDAACGQLVGQVQDRTRRQEQWKAKTIPMQEQAKQSASSGDINMDNL